MPIFDKPKGFSAKFLSKNPLNNGPFSQLENPNEYTAETFYNVPDPDAPDGGFSTNDDSKAYAEWQKQLKKKKKKKVTGGSSDPFAGSKKKKKKKVDKKDRDYDTYSQLNPNNPEKD